MRRAHDRDVSICCSEAVDLGAVQAAVEAAGFGLSPDGRLVITDADPATWKDEVVVRVALVPTEDEALRALRHGAADALVWPTESPRLARVLEAARHRLVDAVGHHVYRDVFRRSPAWIELLDDTVTLIDVSAGFETSTGYARTDAVGRTPAELFRGGTHGVAFYDSILSTLRREGAWQGDMLGRRRDGSLAVVSAHIGSIFTERGSLGQFAVKLEPSRVDPSSLSGWVAGHASDPWLLVKRQGGTIVELGPRVDEVLGRGRAQLLSATFDDLGLDLELPIPDGQASVDRWLGPRAFELTASGRRVGDVDLVVVVFRDVTDRLRRTEDLDALAHDLAMARDQALAADQAKSAFLAGMSHELRTPLTAILGYTEMLEDELPEPDWLRDLGKITSAGRHLLALVDDLLDLARIESGEVALSLSSFEVGGVLLEVADAIRLRAAEAGKTLKVDAPEGLFLFGDRQRVLQVVLNLAANAVKYAVPGVITIGVERGERGVAVFVQDEGPGLSPHDQLRVFHAFRQLHGRSDGVGLGLAISRRLAEAMGGALDVRSCLGEGSRFRLWLRAPDDALGERAFHASG